MRRILAWALIAGVVAGVGALVAESASAASIVAEDVVVSVDRTDIVIGDDPGAGEVTVSVSLLGETNPASMAFMGMEVLMRHGYDDPVNISASPWERESVHTWQAVMKPTHEMDGAELGVRVRSGLGSAYHEVVQYGQVVDVRSAVHIDVATPWLIDEAHRVPVVGVITCYGGEGFQPFHTKFSISYEEAPGKWKLFGKDTVSGLDGRFSVPLTGVPALSQAMVRLKVNVPGFGKIHETCGRTDSQANTYEFDVKQKPILLPTAPQTLTITRGLRAANLAWSPPASDGGAAILGYQVKRGTAMRSFAAGARSFTFAGLQPVSRYTVYVRARNVRGWSPWVGAVLSTTAAPARAYRNCAALHYDYPHGVGKPGARGRGTRVTTFYPSVGVYSLNDSRSRAKNQYDLDSDNDGISCERR